MEAVRGEVTVHEFGLHYAEGVVVGGCGRDEDPYGPEGDEADDGFELLDAVDCREAPEVGLAGGGYVPVSDDCCLVQEPVPVKSRLVCFVF